MTNASSKILNYTTSVPALRSAGEIQSMLVQAGASTIVVEYDQKREISAMCFEIATKWGSARYRMPANVDGVHAVVTRGKNYRALKHWPKERSRDIAWRILKDWIAVQLAFIQAGMAQLPEVFLPYTICADGKSAFQQFEAIGMRALEHQPDTPVR